MRPDGIVLDLDDTLYDTTLHLLPHADRRAAASLRDSGLALDEDEIVRRARSLRAAGCTRIFAEILRAEGRPEAWAAAADAAWFTYEPPPMRLEEDVGRALDELAALAPLALLTSGDPETQRKKVARLGLAPRFAALRYVDHRGTEGKSEALGALLQDRGWTPSRTVVAGDRPDGDVRAANRNGCLAVLVRREGGEFSAVAPASPDDVPWRTIAHVRELPALLRALPG